jgi:hypothetical protein
VPRFSLIGLFYWSVLFRRRYIYVLVVTDWNNPNVRRIACWIGNPIILLFVPTVSFLFDLRTGTPPDVRRYAGRTVIEVLLFLPLWFFVWVYAELLVLGWVWI